MKWSAKATGPSCTARTRRPAALDLDPVLDGVGVEARVLAAAEARAHAALDGPGQAPRKAPRGTATRLPEAREQLLQLLLGLQLLDEGGVHLLLLDEGGQSSVLRARSASRLRRARSSARAARSTRVRCSSVARSVASAPRSERKAGDPLVVAAGQRGHEAIAAEEVGGLVDGEQQPHVGGRRACRGPARGPRERAAPRRGSSRAA